MMIWPLLVAVIVVVLFESAKFLCDPFHKSKSYAKPQLAVHSQLHHIKRRFGQEDETIQYENKATTIHSDECALNVKKLFLLFVLISISLAVLFVLHVVLLLANAMSCLFVCMPSRSLIHTYCEHREIQWNRLSSEKKKLRTNERNSRV